MTFNCLVALASTYPRVIRNNNEQLYPVRYVFTSTNTILNVAYEVVVVVSMKALAVPSYIAADAHH